MFQKILLIILLTVALFGVGSFAQPNAYAEESPSSALESEEFMFDLGVVTPKGMKTEEKKAWIEKGFNFIFERAITIMAATAGSAAVLMMVIGGFRMLISGGRQEEYDKGKSLIFKAVIGLVFVLGAYILVTTIQLLIKSIF